MGIRLTHVPRSRRDVWFLTCEGVELLDLVGPWEVLGHANTVLGYEAFSLRLLSATPGPIVSRHGLQVGRAAALPRRLDVKPDIAIVPGSSPASAESPSQRPLADWLRKRPRISTVVSVCTGAFVLGEAGLLDGRRVTTHWRFLGALQQRFPRARVVDEGIFVRDGKLWTSAGVTAGIDLTLAIVERLHGHEVALTVSQELVLLLRRSGRQAQFSPALQRQQHEPDRLRGLTAYVLEHLDEPLPVPRLALELGMSSRTLTRWCKAHLDMAPAQVVRQMRVDEASRRLVDSSLPLKAIAVETGLRDESTLWRAFTQRFGITPNEYRKRFRHAQTRPL